MNKQPNASFKIVTFVALLLFVVGCASTSTPSLQGTWVTTLTEAESPASYGQWEMTFADGGRFSARLDRTGGTVEGRYTFTQEQYVETDESGRYSCGNETATYKWSVEKDNLTMTPIDDKCGGRRVVLGLHPWSRKK